MSDENSITQMLTHLKSGDEAAAQLIWERFFHRVCGLAEKKLRDNRQRVVDHEDVALSAMNALYAGARDGRFKKLESRDDLWQILAMITVRKTANLWQKQKSRQETGESILGVDDAGQLRGIDDILEGNADELLTGAFDDSCEDLLASLDDKQRKVALLRLQGYSNEEIATKLDRSIKSVERYLSLIRQKWNHAASR